MSDLLNETIRLAKGIDAPVAEICQAARVKARWYYKFVAGDFSDPGITKVERLNRALKDIGRRKRAA